MRGVRRVRGPAVLPVGSRAGGGRQGTVHTRVSSAADGSYRLCLGEISWSWHPFRAGREGRMGGLTFWEAEPREALAGQRARGCIGGGGNRQRQKSPSDWWNENKRV